MNKALTLLALYKESIQRLQHFQFQYIPTVKRNKQTQSGIPSQATTPKFVVSDCLGADIELHAAARSAILSLYFHPVKYLS
jgi:hypothetical protein